MKLVGLIRLGRDAEQRYTQAGDSVVTLSGAWNYGKRDGEGKRPSQWCEFLIWGERGEKLLPHLTKRRQFFVVADEVRVETYERRDGGQGVKLVARIDSLEFCDSREEGGQERQAPPAPAPRAAAAPRAPAPKQSSTFDDLDDDIPF